MIYLLYWLLFVGRLPANAQSQVGTQQGPAKIIRDAISDHYLFV